MAVQKPPIKRTKTPQTSQKSELTIICNSIRDGLQKLLTASGAYDPKKQGNNQDELAVKQAIKGAMNDQKILKELDNLYAQGGTTAVASLVSTLCGMKHKEIHAHIIQNLAQEIQNYKSTSHLQDNEGVKTLLQETIQQERQKLTKLQKQIGEHKKTIAEHKTRRSNLIANRHKQTEKDVLRIALDSTNETLQGLQSKNKLLGNEIKEVEESIAKHEDLLNTAKLIERTDLTKKHSSIEGIVPLLGTDARQKQEIIFREMMIQAPRLEGILHARKLAAEIHSTTTKVQDGSYDGNKDDISKQIDEIKDKIKILDDEQKKIFISKFNELQNGLPEDQRFKLNDDLSNLDDLKNRLNTRYDKHAKFGEALAKQFIDIEYNPDLNATPQTEMARLNTDANSTHISAKHFGIAKNEYRSAMEATRAAAATAGLEGEEAESRQKIIEGEVAELERAMAESRAETERQAKAARQAEEERSRQEEAERQKAEAAAARQAEEEARRIAAAEEAARKATEEEAERAASRQAEEARKAEADRQKAQEAQQEDSKINIEGFVDSVIDSALNTLGQEHVEPVNNAGAETPVTIDQLTETAQNPAEQSPTPAIHNSVDDEQHESHNEQQNTPPVKIPDSIATTEPNPTESGTPQPVPTPAPLPPEQNSVQEEAEDQEKPLFMDDIKIDLDEPEDQEKSLSMDDIKIDLDESEDQEKPLSMDDIKIDLDESEDQEKPLNMDDIKIDLDEPEDQEKPLFIDDIKIDLDESEDQEKPLNMDDIKIDLSEPEKTPKPSNEDNISPIATIKTDSPTINLDDPDRKQPTASLAADLNPNASVTTAPQGPTVSTDVGADDSEKPAEPESKLPKMPEIDYSLGIYEAFKLALKNLMLLYSRWKEAGLDELQKDVESVLKDAKKPEAHEKIANSKEESKRLNSIKEDLHKFKDCREKGLPLDPELVKNLKDNVDKMKRCIYAPKQQQQNQQEPQKLNEPMGVSSSDTSAPTTAHTAAGNEPALTAEGDQPIHTPPPTDDGDSYEEPKEQERTSRLEDSYDEEPKEQERASRLGDSYDEEPKEQEPASRLGGVENDLYQEERAGPPPSNALENSGVISITFRYDKDNKLNAGFSQLENQSPTSDQSKPEPEQVASTKPSPGLS